MIEFYQNYLDNIAQTPKEQYIGLTQATLNELWEDNTQVEVVKEEIYPFNNEYEDVEVLISTVSDVSVNYTKVMGDYISLQFKEIDRKQNYRGQKYIYDNEVYLCYDKINKVTINPRTKCIRCNNQLNYIYEGKVHTEPIFLGYEVSSTNNQVSKEGTVSNERLIILAQSNEFTNSLKENQRFIFQHSQCLRIEQINNFVQESGTNGEVTMLKFHMAFSTINKNKDNVELNVADYYDNIVEETIPNETISEIVLSDIPDTLNIGDSFIVSCDVYDNGIKNNDIVNLTSSHNSGILIENISDVDGNKYKITNVGLDNIVELTFDSGLISKTESVKFSKYLI